MPLQMQSYDVGSGFGRGRCKFCSRLSFSKIIFAPINQEMSGKMPREKKFIGGNGKAAAPMPAREPVQVDFPEAVYTAGTDCYVGMAMLPRSAVPSTIALAHGPFDRTARLGMACGRMQALLYIPSRNHLSFLLIHLFPLP